MTRSPALRDHVAAGLLETAANVLAERGEAAGMSDIAEAAGVARATLYRYFPNREALRSALLDAAFADLMSRVGDAGPDTAPVPEALARLTRAVIGAVSKWRGLEIFHRTPGESEKVQRELVNPVATLIEIYVALLEGAVSRVIRHRLRVEEASTAVTSIFLNGVIVEPASR